MLQRTLFAFVTADKRASEEKQVTLKTRLLILLLTVVKITSKIVVMTSIKFAKYLHYIDAIMSYFSSKILVK